MVGVVESMVVHFLKASRYLLSGFHTMSEVTQLDKKDSELARSILLGNEELVCALYDENSEFQNDFVINVADLLDAKVEGEQIPTREKVKE